MTERPEDIAQAEAAQAAGEAAQAKHAADTERAHQVLSGSDVWVEPAALVDDVAQPGIGRPWTPDGVSPQPSHSPNVVDPLDNSQSQP